jgi:hypothetical protein
MHGWIGRDAVAWFQVAEAPPRFEIDMMVKNRAVPKGQAQRTESERYIFFLKKKGLLL